MLTAIGAEVLEHARTTFELGQTVENIISNKQAIVSSLLRLSAPPSISDSLLTPLVTSFQAAYPEVRAQVLVTERAVDRITEGVDIVITVGTLRDSSLIARRLLTYRHQLLASPEYLKSVPRPKVPEDLLQHRLLAFSRWRPDNRWTFLETGKTERKTITFKPSISMNDFAGLAAALLAGVGIGDLPPIVQPELLREGRLVEVMPKWRFPPFDLSLVHLGNKNRPRHVRKFEEFALDMAPRLFPNLPK